MKFTALLILLAFISSCKNEPKEKSVNETATAKVVTEEPDEDSVAAVDCYGRFFESTAPIDTTRIIVVTREKEKMALAAFIEEYLEKEYLSFAIKDVDKNGVNELWVRHFTMGAHCCDDWYAFIKQPDNTYKQKIYLNAGNVCVEDSVFSFTFDEPLGYFMSCFACGYEDSAKGFVMMRSISLVFRDGKLVIKPYSNVEEQQLFKNLALLQEKGVEAVDESKMDRGIRKEFAMNLAVYHFNHNKEWNLTKQLFSKYYTFKDARKVWGEFKESITLTTENSGL